MPARRGPTFGARPARRRSARPVAVGALVAAVAAVVVVVLLVVGGKDSPTPQSTMESFAAAWSRGDDRGASRSADRPAAAARDLLANRKGLDGARVRATLAAVTEQGDRASARLRVAWQVPRIGPWSYTSRAALRKVDGDWKIAWRPSVVHPKLDTVTRLGTAVEPARRGDILDRQGAPLVTQRKIVRVGVQRDKVKDVRATAAALAQALHLDAGELARAIRGAGPKQFVEAIALRPEDYAKLRDALSAIPDVVTVEDRADLAPSRAFGRALLGTVAPATAEQLQRLGAGYGPGARVGQWGLEAAFERQLGGTPTRSILIRLEGGEPNETLLTRRGRSGRSLPTTLDASTQRAAEQALGDRRDEAALVAVEPSTGDVLAVANRPLDSSYDRALQGRYPPGSTFKVVSTTALLRAGLRPSQPVACPKSLVVDGKLFKNFEGEAAGSVPFGTDFAQSCNTAFVSLADRLGAGALQETARDFGLGRTVKLAVPVAASQVPPGRNAVERAAAMIGQERILASPLAMAGVAATVADGRWRAPRLLDDDPSDSGQPLASGQLSDLRVLMRQVVTSGTGTALAAVPGEPGGKSGTAEFGGGDPLPTHAWFIAYRGDLAVAVLVEHGRSGGSVAAPIAARFFEALDAG